MIEFSCSNCKAVFRVGDEKAGKRGKCPKCGQLTTIPPVARVAAPVRPVASAPTSALADLAAATSGKQPPSARPPAASTPRHAAVPSKVPPPAQPETSYYGVAPDTKTCPHCGEQIQRIAEKCKHCGEWVQGGRRPANAQSLQVRQGAAANSQSAEDNRLTKRKFVFVAAGIAVALIAGVGYAVYSQPNAAAPNAKEASDASKQLSEERRRETERLARVASEEAAARQKRVASEEAAARQKQEQEKQQAELARQQEETKRSEAQKKLNDPPEEDPAASFKVFVEYFTDSYGAQIKDDNYYNTVTDFRYDVKKTDSLVSPILGIVSFKITSQKAAKIGMWNKYVLKFSFSDGKWELGDVQALYHTEGLVDEWVDQRQNNPKAVAELVRASEKANNGHRK